MSDLISRQAAIDEIKEIYEWHNNVTKERIIEHFARLPSAQPEAKPPKWVAEDRYVKNIFKVFPHCPQCNAEIITGDCYCRICGQHIDWSEDDG